MSTTKQKPQDKSQNTKPNPAPNNKPGQPGQPAQRPGFDNQKQNPKDQKNPRK